MTRKSGRSWRLTRQQAEARWPNLEFYACKLIDKDRLNPAAERVRALKRKQKK